MLGTTVAGRYEIKAQIGVGGMGIVYRAHDAKLRRDVALKVIAPHLMQQESARLRFLREAQALAGLMHPNIVTIFDMAEDGESNTVFLVMELLSGHSLRQFLSDETCPRTLNCPHFSDIALPLCRALEAAHKRGVLHRDIKPENIFVCDDGTLKLMDFGLARLLGDVSKNQSSTVAGTLAYMSPEQLRGDKLDARADLYALGVVFFEFVTGTQPFMGDNPGTVLLKHLTEPPPSLKDRLPAAENAEAAINALELLITRMMAKETGERPASATEVRDALEQSLPPGDTLVRGIDVLLAAQGERGMGIAHSPTQALPTSPVSVPIKVIAAQLTARQTTELPLDTLPQIPAVALPVANDTTPPKENSSGKIPGENSSPAWKRRGGVLVGIGVLGAASVLAMSQFTPRNVPTTDAGTSASLLYKQRDKQRGITIGSSISVRSTTPASSGTPNPAASQGVQVPASGSSLVSKSGSSPSASKTAGLKPIGETPISAKDADPQAGKTASTLPPKSASAPNDKSSDSASLTADKTREARRRAQQEELALIQSLKKIKSLKQELAAARAVKAVAGAGEKTSHPVAAPLVTGVKSVTKPAKSSALPNVADEAKPPLAIGMKVMRVTREDKKAVHISLQNDVDCYAYFYLIPPNTREATRLFAGYEYFAAAPKTPYMLHLLLPRDVPNSRGAVLIVAAKKELKNLPASFESPQMQTLPPAPTLNREQRQQIGRQNTQQSGDQVAQQLASNRVLQGGQLMQPHDVVIHFINSNPMIFGRKSDGSRRGPGQQPSRRRRNLPPPAEPANTK